VPQRDLVVIGASAGGVEALTRLVGELPARLPAAVLVVLHLSPDGPSNLPAILDRVGPLRAAAANEGDRLEQGLILCAPPDHHLTVHDGGVRVRRGPHENLHRPSVDVLFRSAALHRDGRTCGVVLSGALDDGTSGLRAIKRTGGMTIVQDPADALIPSMPLSAIQAVRPDHVLAADVIGRRLGDLVDGSKPASRHDTAAWTKVAQEVAMSELTADQPPIGRPSPYGCPDCGGVLWEIPDGRDVRYRCRTGHAYSTRALLAAGHEGLDDALWAALRALEEQESLAGRLLDRVPGGTGGDGLRRRLEERASTASRRADLLRELLLSDARDPFDEDGNGSGGAAVDRQMPRKTIPRSSRTPAAMKARAP
jgi:two-component system, chemotaxis family, protein-glutamate methylesterase/glutaminase